MCGSWQENHFSDIRHFGSAHLELDLCPLCIYVQFVTRESSFRYTSLWGCPPRTWCALALHMCSSWQESHISDLLHLGGARLELDVCLYVQFVARESHVRFTALWKCLPRSWCVPICAVRGKSVLFKIVVFKIYSAVTLLPRTAHIGTLSCHELHT